MERGRRGDADEENAGSISKSVSVSPIPPVFVSPTLHVFRHPIPHSRDSGLRADNATAPQLKKQACDLSKYSQCPHFG
jgi:hypothetical protein